VHAPETEHQIVEHSAGVFTTIRQLREYLPRVTIATKALQETPKSGQGREKAHHQTEVRRIALDWIIPAVLIEAEKQWDILGRKCQKRK